MIAEKPCLILLPGMDGTGRLFRWLLPHLESFAHPVVINYPTDRLLGYDGLAAYVIRRLPEGPHMILAESFSGPVAAMVASRKPPELRGLVFSTSFVAPPAPRCLKAAVLDFWFRIPVPRPLLRYLLLDSKCPTEVTGEVAAASQAAAPDVMAARLQEALTVDAREALQSCSIPVLALAATHDRLIGLRGLETIRDARPDATCYTLEGPHLLLQTQPRAVADLIRFQMEGWSTARVS